MTSAFENLTGPGKPLRAEPLDAKEFAGLQRSGLARLKDATQPALSVEGRFDLAYNAAHALALYALRRLGYRSDNRYLVFQALPHTLGLPAAQWRVLARAHEQRNLAEYEGHLEHDDQLLVDLLAATGLLLAAIHKLPKPDAKA